MSNRTVSKVINRGAHSYLILHDPCHGPKSNRYTVYKIHRHPGHKKSGRTQIIGRELSWGYSINLINKQVNKKLFW